MVATKLRDLHVPLHSGPCHPTKRVQEALPHPAAQEQYVYRRVSDAYKYVPWHRVTLVSLHLEQKLTWETEILSVPKNMKLLAVPLYELYDNVQRYGPQLSAIPHLLSRYNFEFVDEEDNVVAVTPGTGPLEYVVTFISFADILSSYNLIFVADMITVQTSTQQ